MPPPERSLPEPGSPGRALLEAFESIGVQAGHRVAVLAGRTPLHLAAHEACRALGAVLVPLDPRAPSSEWAKDAAATGVDTWIVEGPDHSAERPHVPPGDAANIRAGPDGSIQTVTGRVASPPSDDVPDLRYLVATSGTTGKKRWVPITEAQLAHHAAAAAKRLRSGPDARWLCVLPLHHIGGIALLDRCLRGHGSVVLDHRTDGPGLVEALGMGITHVSVVPTQLHRILATGAQPPSALRCVLVGGDRTDPDLVQAALGAGWPIHTTYGCTEACSQVATATPEELRLDPSTVGRPLDGVQVHIVAPGGAPSPKGQEGEIVVAGPTVGVGSVRTGDMGRMVAGHLHVSGRISDRIISGGENVDPARVEAAVAGFPGVASTCVVGAPDPEWGQLVVALVETDDDPSDPEPPTPALDMDALDAWCRDRLAPHERPRRWVVVDRLPRTDAGKLRRQDARRLIQSS